MKGRIIAVTITILLLLLCPWYFLRDLRARTFSLPAERTAVRHSFGVTRGDMTGALGVTLGSCMTTYDLKLGRTLYVRSRIVGAMTSTSHGR